MEAYQKLREALQKKTVEEKSEFYNKMEPSKLWNFIKILNESEKMEVYDLLTDETVYKLKEFGNPYRKPIYEPKETFLQFSYINMRREYERHLQITAFVGFFYKMATEYKAQVTGLPSEDDQEFIKLYNKVLVNFTCDKLSQYYGKLYETHPNPENHVKFLRAQAIVAERRKLDNDKLVEEARSICVDHGLEYEECFPEEKPVTPEELVEIKKFVKAQLNIIETVEERQEAIQDHILDFLDYYLKYDPNNHIRCGYFPHYEAMVSKKVKENPENFEVRVTPSGSEMIVNSKFEEYLVPPHDTFAAFSAYFDSNYEYLRECTDNIYCPDIFECAVLPREVFSTQEKGDRWLKKYAEDFDMSVMRAPLGRWTFVDPWQKNREAVSFDNEKTQFIKEILERKKEDEKIGRKLLDKKAKKMKGRAADNIPVESQLKDFGAEKVGADELEIKVYETKLLRKPRMKPGQFTGWSFSVEAEAPEKN